MNTEFITKPKPIVKKATLWGYRGLSAGAIIWMFTTFATKNDVDRLRDWQLSNSRRISQLQSNVLVLELTTVKVKPYE